jgi:1-acyl-sn-glycerol-3-phosphate acyltransferase
MRLLRSACFYLGYASATIVWGGLSALFGWILPYRTRFDVVIGWWTAFCLGWLRLTCGIVHRVEGLEHIPETPCIVLCRHESTWETLFLQRVFAPQATLIKRELLHIPFFGWAFRGLKPIAIDRRQQRKALRTLIDEGSSRLSSGIWVVLFPEGTRMVPGQLGKLQPGGAALASASAAPVVVVSHDAGQFWPAHRFIKHPGEIRVLISEPIPTKGRSTKEIQAAIEETFRWQMARLEQRRARPEMLPPAAPVSPRQRET